MEWRIGTLPKLIEEWQESRKFNIARIAAMKGITIEEAKVELNASESED